MSGVVLAEDAQRALVVDLRRQRLEHFGRQLEDLLFGALLVALRRRAWHLRLQREQRVEEHARLLDLRGDVAVRMLAERLRVVVVRHQVDELAVAVQRAVLWHIVVRQHAQPS